MATPLPILNVTVLDSLSLVAALQVIETLVIVEKADKPVPVVVENDIELEIDSPR